MHRPTFLLATTLLGLSAAAAVGDTHATPPVLAPLAAAALSTDPSAAKLAIDQLRRSGPDAVPALLAYQQAKPVPAARFNAALDQVCAQFDCATSHLFWYTDLAMAKAEARRSGRPILSLRLLGRLDEEMSCANSRFFRTVLYANPDVSRLLREGYVLHWSSERPVPKMTIDFGDGRALKGTITGNSIHYVLDPGGRLVDAIPGLYGPVAFARMLAADQTQAGALGHFSDHDIALLTPGFHAAESQRINRELKRDLDRIGTPWQAAQKERQGEKPTAMPTAFAAAPIAMSKRLGEAVPLDAISIGARQRDVAGVNWQRIAELHRSDWELDAKTLADLERRPALAALAPSLRRQAVRRFVDLIGVDTVRNEYLYHEVLHTWLSLTNEAETLEHFNRRVYADLFLTPRSDPWLGLAAPETFMALEPAGP